MDEFSLIEKYFNWPISFNKSNIIKAIGDDCAIIDPKFNSHLLITTDCLIENVHFPKNTSPELIASKSLAVNLSDLAAMGGYPAWYTLVIGLPLDIDEKWLKSFSQALFEQSKRYQIDLIGGDTVKSEQLFITIQMHGYAHNNIMQRDKAIEGDIIAVTGSLGAAALGLRLVLGDKKFKSLPLTDIEKEAALNALNSPKPQIDLGIKISKFSQCALDISDGLMADLEHITSKSHCGAQIDIDKIPLADCLLKLPREEAIKLALTGGDDYQLCFTITNENWMKIQADKFLSEQCTDIGKIVSTKGIQLLYQDTTINQLAGCDLEQLQKGYNHFN